jgi:hypothetical protein
MLSGTRAGGVHDNPVDWSQMIHRDWTGKIDVAAYMNSK